MTVTEAVTQLTQAVDTLLTCPLPDSATELTETLRRLEVERNRLEAVDQRLLAHAGTAAVAGGFGRVSLAEVLVTALRVDRHEAGRRVKRAEALGPRWTLTGEPVPPVLPATAAAVANGVVSASQVEQIIHCLDAIPDSAPVEAWPVAEQFLLTAARVETPGQLRRTARALLARLDPDGLAPVEELIERHRGFTLVKKPDGSAVPRGLLTAELTAMLETVLDSLAAPQHSADQPDTRTASQRRHDGLAEALRRVLRSGTLPDSGGIPVTILATIPAAELAEAAQGNGAGLALLGHGGLISANRLLAMAGEATVIPVVVNDAGGVLAHGTGHRLATPTQRKALVARDGGCSFPGCDRPAAWTEAHHITPHATGGPTTLDNLTLACRHHHRTFEAAGWQVRMGQDHVPEWLPPPWLDPQRRPRRNTVHHRPDLDFQPPTAA